MNEKKFKDTIEMIVRDQAKKIYQRSMCENCIEIISCRVLNAIPLLALFKIVEHAEEEDEISPSKQSHE